MSRGRHAKPSSLPSASTLAAAAPAVLVVAAAASVGATAVPAASAGLSPSGTTQSSGTVGTAGMSAPANVDYASGGYGVYNSAALSNPAIQGVVINVGWNAAEPSRGSYNWTPLDNEASAWAAEGKHVAIVVRFASEVDRGGTCTDGFLPAWEASRIPIYCDSDVPDIIPDYFNSTFQADFGAFVTALGDHLKSASYKDNISYIRIGVGLAAEGFDLMRKGRNPDVSTDVAYITKNWGYTPAKWEAWQEQMLSSYQAAMPSGIPILYPIVKQDTDPGTGNPVDLDVAEWWLRQGGGLGQENLPPGGFGNPGYADFGAISMYMKAYYPSAYVEFQSEDGLSSSGVSQSIATAESYGARSIEWYEDEAISPTFNLAMGG